jgi:hypothetical protein
VIEPWAAVETVPAGGIVMFEVNAAPPPETEFSITETGRQYIYVMSEHVVISINGEVRHEFQTATRPPIAAFRVLNGLLWGRPDGAS